MNKNIMQPPNRINYLLIIIVQTIALGSLAIGSQLNLVGMVCCAIIYSFILQTNYALIHEATHNILNANSKLNVVLGSLCCCLFPLPFSIVRITHAMHHRHNRDPNERFDLYEDNHFSWSRFVNWYGILTGFFWLFTVIGLNLIAIFPSLLKRLNITRSSPHVLRALRIYYAQNTKLLPRLQIVAIVGYWILAIGLLKLTTSMLLLGLIAFAFNWSTRQYIQHAYASLDNILGSHNLTTNKLNGLILLNGQWDLIHHRYPYAPWIALPLLAKQQPPEAPHLSYGKQYLRMWQGPMYMSQLQQIYPQHNRSSL